MGKKVRARARPKRGLVDRQLTVVHWPLGVETPAATAQEALDPCVDRVHARRSREASPPPSFRARRGWSRCASIRRTGLLAYDGEEDAIEELFLQGTEPQTVSTPSASGDGGTAVTPGAGLAEGAEGPAVVEGRPDGGRRADPPLF